MYMEPENLKQLWEERGLRVAQIELHIKTQNIQIFSHTVIDIHAVPQTEIQGRKSPHIYSNSPTKLFYD